MKTKLPVTITKGLQLQNNATHKTLNKLYITIASIWRVNMLGYVSADITCPEKWTVSESKIRGKLSRWASWSGYCPRTNTWAYQVQSQMRAFVFIILEIFFWQHAGFRNWGNSSSDNISWIMSDICPVIDSWCAISFDHRASASSICMELKSWPK